MMVQNGAHCEGAEVMRHPYGVKPEGNLLMLREPKRNASASASASLTVTAVTINVLNACSLGRLRILDDAALVQVLGWLDAKSLCRASLSSRALYVFCHTMSLWRELTLNRFGGKFSYSSSWKETFIRSSLDPEAKTKFTGHSPLEIENCFSTKLYEPWLKAAALPIDPQWLKVDNVERRSGLNHAAFVEEFAEQRRPVILTDVVPSWAAFKEWRSEALLKRCGDTSFRVSASFDQTLADYVQYAEQCEHSGDERPLYLFEKDFFKKVPGASNEFQIPEPFAEDLMQVLGPDQRPDYRWLIMGPARSGSSFHVDPNYNFAWSACIQGRKKWVLYPPHIQPPGLEDNNVSLIQWFHRYYLDDEYANERIECITGPGEIMFVPRGWWHCVLNLEFCVALTHNVVMQHNLLDAVDFLREGETCQPGSGCNGPVAINFSGDVPASVIFPYKNKLGKGRDTGVGNEQQKMTTEEKAQAQGPGTKQEQCKCILHKRKLFANFSRALREKRPGMLEKLRVQQANKEASRQSLWDKLGLNNPGAKEEGKSFSFRF